MFLNGRWLPADQARVSVADQGFLYGAGLFETMLVRRGRVPLVGLHLRRLAEGAAALGIALPMPMTALEAAVVEAVERNGLEDGALRLTLTAGVQGEDTPRARPGEETAADGGAPTLLIAVRRGRPYAQALYDRGFTAVWAAARRNHLSPLAGRKTTSYLESLLARREARAAGADEALFLNVSGCLAEGAASNVFWVADGRIHTPSPACGALPGVARAVVLELARAGGMACAEGEYPGEALAGAAEAFLTNALMGVMPLVRLEGRPIGDGRPGRVTARLRALFEDRLDGGACGGAAQWI